MRIRFPAFTLEIKLVDWTGMSSDKQSDKKTIEAAEMRFLRPMAGYTFLDKKRSSDIREQLGIF